MDLDEKKEDSRKANKANEDETPAKHRDTERDLKDDFVTNVHIFNRELGIENLDKKRRLKDYIQIKLFEQVVQPFLLASQPFCCLAVRRQNWFPPTPKKRKMILTELQLYLNCLHCP